MTSKYTGKCACGSIKIAIPQPTDCMDCRRFSGTVGGHYLMPRVEAADMEVTDKDGLAGKWTKKTDAGNMIHRHFCTNCASPLYDTVDRADRNPDAASVYAGLFESKTLPPVKEELYWCRAEEWERPYPGAKSYEKMDGWS